jgi:hypothetical protein
VLTCILADTLGLLERAKVKAPSQSPISMPSKDDTTAKRSGQGWLCASNLTSRCWAEIKRWRTSCSPAFHVENDATPYAWSVSIKHCSLDDPPACERLRTPGENGASHRLTLYGGARKRCSNGGLWIHWAPCVDNPTRCGSGLLCLDRLRS